MNIPLKIKIKNLADEAREIRRQELKCKAAGDHGTRESLYLHRIGRVRQAARSTQLAYAFLRGKRYSATEQPLDGNCPNVSEIARMIKKYGADKFETLDKEMCIKAVKCWLVS